MGEWHHYFSQQWVDDTTIFILPQLGIFLTVGEWHHHSHLPQLGIFLVNMQDMLIIGQIWFNYNASSFHALIGVIKLPRYFWLVDIQNMFIIGQIHFKHDCDGNSFLYLLFSIFLSFFFEWFLWWLNYNCNIQYATRDASINEYW